MITAKFRPARRHRRGADAARAAGGRIACTLVLLVLALGAGPAPAAVATDVILVLDNSGSMRKNDPDFIAKSAVSGFVSGLGADTRAGILIFDQDVDYAVPLTDLNAEARAAIQQSLDAIDYRGQLTDSPAAIERAIYELKTSARPDVEKVIVFMTDGIVDTGNADVDTEKTKWMREELAADAADNGIRVFAIAFTENADFFLIQSLAKRTDGEYFRALAPEDLPGVFDSIEDKLAAPPPAPAPVPAPAPPPVAAPAPAPVAPAPGGTDCLSTLVPDERIAFEEMAIEAGIPAEQLCNEMMAAPEGTAVVVRPEDAAPADAGGDLLGLVVLVAFVVVVLALLVLVVVLLLRRRRGAPAAASPATVPDAFLKDIHGIADDPAVKLGPKPTMIGRVAGNDPEELDYFVVNKGTIGRRHAMIKYRDYAFWLIDQGSVNGTFLNGERIDGERQLKHGDRVKFHKYEFEFSMPEMEDAGHTVFADPADLDATMVGEVEPVAPPPVGAAAGVSAAAGAVAADEADTALSARQREAQADDDAFADMETGIRPAPDDDFAEMETGIRPSPAAPDDDFADMETGVRPAPEMSDDDFAEMETGVHPAQGGAPADDADVGAGDGASAAVPDDDMELVTIMPDAGGTVPPVDPAATMDTDGAEAAFDAEASAFFEESFGPPSVDDDMPVEPPPPVAPAAGPPADEDFNESETLLPASMTPDEALEQTSDISLDEFMDTEAFQASPLPTDDDADDATLLPADVSEPPAIDDVFDITAEGEVVPEEPRRDDAAGTDDEDDDDDDGGESPTVFRS